RSGISPQAASVAARSAATCPHPRTQSSSPGKTRPRRPVPGMRSAWTPPFRTGGGGLFNPPWKDLSNEACPHRLPSPLVPKLRLGTQKREALLPVQARGQAAGADGKRSFPPLRSQAELGNEAHEAHGLPSVPHFVLDIPGRRLDEACPRADNLPKSPPRS